MSQDSAFARSSTAARQRMSNKHTPGPWEIHENDMGLEVHPTWDEHGEHIIADFPRDVCVDSHANARLIAAAPEMFEALEECLRWLYQSFGEPPQNPESMTGPHRAILEARAAIAKAEGKDQP